MKYQEEKLEIIELIKKLVEKGIFTIDEIAFHILNNTGYSELFVRKYIDKSLIHGFFIINKEGKICLAKKGEEKKQK
jgi:predicted transcriptional regulator YheO